MVPRSIKNRNGYSLRPQKEKSPQGKKKPLLQEPAESVGFNFEGLKVEVESRFYFSKSRKVESRKFFQIF